MPAAPKTLKAPDGPRRLTRRESKELTREKLLAAGRKVIAEQGLNATQIRDIIGEAGLAIGTFYLHFKSKEELFAALMEESAQQLSRRLRAVRLVEDSRQGVIERARNACRAFCEFVLAEQDLFRVLFREGLAGTGPQRDVGRHMIDMAVSDLRADLEQGGYLKVLHPKDLDALAAGIIGMCTAVGFRLLEVRNPDIDHTTEVLTRMAVGAMSAMGTFPSKPKK